MLVLSRKRSEAIRIGSEVVIRVIEVRGDRVRLGIAAPSTLPVHREEVYQRIAQELLAGQDQPCDSPAPLTESRYYVECA